MKTVNRILPMLLICLFLFSGCAPACTAERVPASPVPTAVPTPEPTPKTPTVTHTVRVIYAYEDGSMMLADQNSSSVYRNKLPDGETYPAGTLLTLTCADSVQATFPESFDKIFDAEPIEDGFDDRCALYLDVFEDLWSEDTALQHETDYLGVDLSETSLTESEQLALSWCFGELKEKEVLNGTFKELCEAGYINEEDLYWDNGCFVSIREEGFLTDEEKDLYTVTFTAQKWRSGLGAIMFTNCTAERNKKGEWRDYTPGGFAIA